MVLLVAPTIIKDRLPGNPGRIVVLTTSQHGQWVNLECSFFLAMYQVKDGRDGVGRVLRRPLLLPDSPRHKRGLPAAC